MLARPIALAALLALAACAESEEASLVPIDESEGYNVIDPVAAPTTDEGALSLGDWTRGTLEERPALMFGPAGAAPLFSMRCDDRQGLLLQRHGVIPSGEAEMMTVTLGTTSRRLAVNPVTGTVPLVRAAVPANDDLLRLLAGAEMPISVGVGDDPPLNLPPTPLIGTLIGDCAAETPATPAEEGNAAAEAPEQVADAPQQ